MATYAPFVENIKIYKGTTFSYQFNFDENGSALDLTTLNDIKVTFSKPGQQIFEHTISGGDLTISGASNNELTGEASASTMDIAKRSYDMKIKFIFSDGSEDIYVDFNASIVEGENQTAHEWNVDIDTDAETTSGEQLTGLTARAVTAAKDAESFANNLDRAGISSGDAGKIERVGDNEDEWTIEDIVTVLDAEYEDETISFKTRVIEDGGEVVDLLWVDLCIKKAKVMGIYNDLVFWTDANFAVKKDSSGIQKLYDISTNENDVTQSTDSNKPSWVQGANFSNRGSNSFDQSSGQYLSVPSSYADSDELTLVNIFDYVSLDGGANPGLWEFLSGSSKNGLLAIDSGNNKIWARIYQDDGSFVATNSGGVLRPDLSTNTPYISVVTAKGDRVNLYINTNLYDNAEWDGTLLNTDGASISKQASEYWDGRQTSVLLVKSGLTDAQIRDIGSFVNSRYGVDDAYDGDDNLLSYNNAWTWFNSPQAFYDSDTGNLVAGSLTSVGDVKVVEYGDGEVKSEVILKKKFEQDDHNNPAVIKMGNDKYLAVYQEHGGDQYARISTNPNDASSWDSEITINDASSTGENITYAQLIKLDDESGKIYLFFRSNINGQPKAFRTSDDNGQTWSSKTELFNNGSNRPYMHVAKNGSARIDFTITDGHPNEVTNNNLYHFYYESGKYYKSDGTLIGDDSVLPLTPSDVTQVYDADSTGHDAWSWDIKINDQDRPMIAYAEIRSATDHRYRLAEWDGQSWQDEEVATGGRTIYEALGDEDDYSGGIAIYDKETVFLSSDDQTSYHAIYKYTKEDGQWQQDELINTSYGNNGKNVRPVVPENAQSSLAVLWLYGRYRTYQDYYLDLMGAEL